ncbi:HU family DNA-binding protein [Spirulina subsalsa FACHB-351]|uniref:Viral histone-like protein n=1 Tax=Spirulina subsalsa FACHB-351 TaxID=234711 RepID=A0ABT3LAL8_9CYAN|nr:HU family DNA-binding protein [Spirulina subsalsa FACHB-351]
MMKPMTKTELLATLAEKSGIEKKDVSSVLDALSEVATSIMAKGGALTLPGLGKLACRDRPERQVRNPSTGEAMTKPADRVVKFTVAKALKDSVNS